MMDRAQGDLKVIWDPERPEEVAAALEQFNSLLAKGYMAYAVNSRGNKGTQVREFDPEAEKLILAPALRGG